MADVAEYAEMALQDALKGFGRDCHYDVAAFLVAMRAYGYEIVPAPPDADSQPDSVGGEGEQPKPGATTP